MINIKHNNMGILFFINICKQNQIAVTIFYQITNIHAIISEILKIPLQMCYLISNVYFIAVDGIGFLSLG